MHKILEKDGFICDMDGVIYHGNEILDGVAEFVNWMIEHDKKFVFLTNSPERTPHELSMKLERMGLKVSADHFYTSAMATAEFLNSQAPGCTAYVIGEAALSKALYDLNIYMNDINPDYVVVGETRTYCFEKIEKAIDEGFDVRGYYLWSLMDNFEWTAAYNFKFGIMSTDFATGETKWKKSAYFYRDFIKAAMERSK